MLLRILFGWVPAVLVSVFLILASGLPKLYFAIRPDPNFPDLGLGDYLLAIGIAEIVFSVLLLIPRTATIGFVLLVGLLGGASGAGLALNDPNVWPWFPLALIGMLTVSAYFRSPELLSRAKGTL